MKDQEKDGFFYIYSIGTLANYRGKGLICFKNYYFYIDMEK